jgi:hypothetical protein
MMALLDPTDIGLAGRFDLFLRTQPDVEGNTGWSRFFGWIANLDERFQQEFLDLLSGKEQDALTQELDVVITKMKEAQMDVSAITAGILNKTPVEEIGTIKSIG